MDLLFQDNPAFYYYSSDDSYEYETEPCKCTEITVYGSSVCPIEGHRQSRWTDDPWETDSYSSPYNSDWEHNWRWELVWEEGMHSPVLEVVEKPFIEKGISFVDDHLFKYTLAHKRRMDKIKKKARDNNERYKFPKRKLCCDCKRDRFKCFMCKPKYYSRAKAKKEFLTELKN